MNELSPMEEEWANFDPTDEITWTEDIVSYFKHVNELKREARFKEKERKLYSESVSELKVDLDNLLKEIDEFTNKKGIN